MLIALIFTSILAAGALSALVMHVHMHNRITAALTTRADYAVCHFCRRTVARFEVVLGHIRCENCRSKEVTQ